MTSLYVIKSLQNEKVISDEVLSLFSYSGKQIYNSKQDLAKSKQRLKKWWQERTSCVSFWYLLCRSCFSTLTRFGWVYNGDIIVITALTGAGAYKIPNGKYYKVRLVFMLTNSNKIIKICGYQQKCSLLTRKCCNHIETG